MKNRKVRLVLLLALMLSTVLTVVMTASAAVSYSWYVTQNFNGSTFSVGTPASSLSVFNHYPTPSLAVVATDPVDSSNKVIQMLNKTDGSDAVNEASNGGLNIDKNLVINNKVMSYSNATSNTFVLQADYFIPDGANGTFEAQHIAYSYNAGADKGSYLNYFRINTASGELVASITGSQSLLLEKNVWNTISMVLNLETGASQLYINNILKTEGVITKNGELLTNISLDANRWNIAKINKNGGYPEAFSGCFYVDNVVAHNYDASMTQTFSADPDEDGNPALYIDLTLSNKHVIGAAPGSTILLNKRGVNEVTANTVYLDNALTDGVIAPVNGAQLRLSSATGLRFGTYANKEKLEALWQLEKDKKVKSFEIGTLIAPTEYVTRAGAFTHEALSTLDYKSNYLDVEATMGHYYNSRLLGELEGYNTAFVGSIVNLKSQNISRTFSGVGYFKLTLLDGSEIYYYSYDYDAGDASWTTNHSRSASYLASQLLSGGAYKEEDKKLLESFMDGVTVMNVSSSYINNVQYTYDGFYFSNAAGIACYLTYDGNNGWRFQATKPKNVSSPYANFNGIGAAQALALYMGEGYSLDREPLTVTKGTSDITIKANGTDAYVTVHITGSFGINFYTGEGKLTNNITSIVSNGTTVQVTGGIDTNEAIYGGGERFTSSNQKGKLLHLYSYDAYNGGNSDVGKEKTGTYVAIPLFMNTRGGGMFINRYEYMEVDLGKTDSKQWSVNLDHNLYDCYFYATGNITDVLQGYIDLTGHPTMPEEWAQGILICRYAPDSANLEGEVRSYAKLEDIPGYEKLTTASNGTELCTSKWNGTSYTATRPYLYSGSSAKYVWYDDGTGYAFHRCSTKGSLMGAGIKAVVENLIAAGMKPTAYMLEGFSGSWINTTNGNTTSNSNRQKLMEVVEYLESKGIKTMLYMGIATVDSSMPGYKSEYHLRANISYNITQGSNTTTPHTFGNNGAAGIWVDKGGDGNGTYRIIKNGTSENPDVVDANAAQVYLDISNPEAVEWYMNVVWGDLLDLGIDGIKIDFCETMPDENVPITLQATNKSTKKLENVGTATVDYLWYDEDLFEEGTVHHAYPTYFISLFYREMNRLKEEKQLDDGFSVLSRGGGIGSQRNPYLWTGDQIRNEENLTNQLHVVINSGLSGLPFITPDMAGYAYSQGSGTNVKNEHLGGYYSGYFGGPAGNYITGGSGTLTTEQVSDVEAEIFIRALQYTAFSTAIQTHGDVRQAYEFDLIGYEDGYAQKVIEKYSTLHEDLLPYIRKYSQIACDTGLPVVRHMVINYQNDANVYNLDTQFMLGESLLIAPILELDETSRTVYLPKGKWVDCLSGTVYDVGESGKTLTLTDITIDKIPVFLKLDTSDTGSLSVIFNSANWQSINGGKAIAGMPENIPEDPYENDIFPPLSEMK